MTDETAATPEPDRPPRQQRRARKIAMGQAELDAFLAGQRTCRVATAVTSWDFRLLQAAQAQARKTTS